MKPSTLIAANVLCSELMQYVACFVFYYLLQNYISVNIDASEIPRKKVRVEEKEANVSQKPKVKKEEKATDDYHYEKFKKQYRRY